MFFRSGPTDCDLIAAYLRYRIEQALVPMPQYLTDPSIRDVKVTTKGQDYKAHFTKDQRDAGCLLVINELFGLNKLELSKDNRPLFTIVAGCEDIIALQSPQVILRIIKEQDPPGFANATISLVKR